MITRLFVVSSCLLWAGTSTAQETPQAVPTFHCVGLYWSPQGGAENTTCRVRYRAIGSPQWKEALPLWFDGRSPDEELPQGEGATVPAKHCAQYRGSIVNLTPATQYEAHLALEDGGPETRVTFRTWDETFPVADTVTVSGGSEPLVIDRSGSPDGYVLYTQAPSAAKATIDVANEHAQCVDVRASYVIIRGLTLKNAREHGIRIFEGCHDVVIEDCDVSGWGRISDDGWGRNLDSAVYSRARNLTRVVVQRNTMHHPRGDSNTWKEHRPRPGKREPYHPEGPQGVYFSNSEGNHVIRYNTVFSDDDHQYNDIFGAASNFSLRGFPNRDSDIYGNLLSHCWDDAIESEGANCNVRIWGNYTTECFVSVACASTSIGPLYVWRNVSDVMRVAPGNWGGGFLKTSNKMGGGRVFVFHNTVLQPTRVLREGKTTVGAHLGLGWGGPMINVTSRNNVLHVKHTAIRDRANDPLADYDYDLWRGELQCAEGHETHGINDEPVYAGRHGVTQGSGRLWLAPDSPGYDAGLRLPNLNDGYTGAAPDMGAHEAETRPLRYGAHVQQR